MEEFDDWCVVSSYEKNEQKTNEGCAGFLLHPELHASVIDEDFANVCYSSEEDESVKTFSEKDYDIATMDDEYDFLPDHISTEILTKPKPVPIRCTADVLFGENLRDNYFATEENPSESEMQFEEGPTSALNCPDPIISGFDDDKLQKHKGLKLCEKSNFSIPFNIVFIESNHKNYPTCECKDFNSNTIPKLNIDDEDMLSKYKLKNIVNYSFDAKTSHSQNNKDNSKAEQQVHNVTEDHCKKGNIDTENKTILDVTKHKNDLLQTFFNYHETTFKDNINSDSFSSSSKNITGTQSSEDTLKQATSRCSDDDDFVIEPLFKDYKTPKLIRKEKSSNQSSKTFEQSTKEKQRNINFPQFDNPLPTCEDHFSADVFQSEAHLIDEEEGNLEECFHFVSRRKQKSKCRGPSITPFVSSNLKRSNFDDVRLSDEFYLPLKNSFVALSPL